MSEQEIPWVPLNNPELDEKSKKDPRSTVFKSVYQEPGYSFPRQADRVERDPNPGFNSRKEEADKKAAERAAKVEAYADKKAETKEAARKREYEARKAARKAAKGETGEDKTGKPAKRPSRAKTEAGIERAKAEESLKVREMTDEEKERAEQTILPEDQRISKEKLEETPWKNRRPMAAGDFPQATARPTPTGDRYKGRTFHRVTVTSPSGEQISRPMTATEHIDHHTQKAEEFLASGDHVAASPHWKAVDFWEDERDNTGDNWYENMPEIQSGVG